ncbi:HAD family hydrolase [Rhodobacteraceae bacterium NNCM2]|nr:HAD family hydrolase [Coraliihabitans acroporae]
MTPGLVIFDCDGVLVDTEPVANEVLHRMLGDLGLSMDMAEVMERFVGRSMKSVAAEVEALLGRPLDPGWIGEVRAETLAAFREHGVAPIPGVKQAIAEIDARGIPICVGSSGSVEKMTMTLGAAGLWDRLGGHLFTAQDVANGKPAPDLFLHAAASMGVAPGRCVVIEDSPFGVSAAVAAGMRALGYTGGPDTSAEKLRAKGAEIFSEMGQLPGLLGLEKVT